MTESTVDERELIKDLESLGGVLTDDSFAEELYRALSNTTWRKADGPDGHLALSWSRAEAVVNQLREREGQEPLVLSQTGDEGQVSDRVEHELGRLGWSAKPLNTSREDPGHSGADRQPKRQTPPNAEWARQAHAEADENRGAS